MWPAYCARMFFEESAMHGRRNAPLFARIVNRMLWLGGAMVWGVSEMLALWRSRLSSN